MANNNFDDRESQFDTASNIYGHDIRFPVGMRPFPPQLAVMSKSLEALVKKENALLESPTGTGKTLALLSSTLAWQLQDYKSRLSEYDKSQSLAYNSQTLVNKLPFDNNCLITPCHEIITEPSTVVDYHHSKKSLKSLSNCLSNKIDRPELEKPSKKRIFYCSRTHSQIGQVIDQLKNCHPIYLEELSMCILGSRSHLCINKSILDKTTKNQTATSIDEECREAIKNCQCSHFNYSQIKRTSKELDQVSVWDIEDAVMLGKKHRGCSYYSTRSLLQQATLIFAPYNFILDKSIRELVGIDLKDSVIIFDEAHNIEDIARAAASMTIARQALLAASIQVRTLATSSAVAFVSLSQMLDKVLLWFDETVELLDSTGSTMSDSNVWRGDEALDILERHCGITEATLAIYKEHFKTVMSERDDVINQLISEEEEEEEEDTDAGSSRSKRLPTATRIKKKAKLTRNNRQEPSVFTASRDASLSSNSCFIIRSLLTVIGYMLADKSRYVQDFKMTITQSTKGTGTANGTEQSPNTTAASGNVCLNIWCLNAAVTFSHLSVGSEPSQKPYHSLLLTSGTLSPLESFACELGVSFKLRVEANHVIDTKKQIFIAAISSSSNISLQSTYANQNNLHYQDALGTLLHTTARCTPGGVLIFLPSYHLLTLLSSRWRTTGLMDLLEKECISVYQEPKTAKQLTPILTNYYRAIDKGAKAVLIAVCRGKVSEGINFADNYARAVVMVGIPYPNTQDLNVQLKKQRQNELPSADSQPKTQTHTQHLSSGSSSHGNGNGNAGKGNAWYQQQAFRAVNQAIGRCIRHQKDYGAILLCDYRYARPDSQQQLSRWLRSSVTNFDKFESAVLPLLHFFASNKVAGVADQMNQAKGEEQGGLLVEQVSRKKSNTLSGITGKSSIASYFSSSFPTDTCSSGVSNDSDASNTHSSCSIDKDSLSSFVNTTTTTAAAVGSPHVTSNTNISLCDMNKNLPAHPIPPSVSSTPSGDANGNQRTPSPLLVSTTSKAYRIHTNSEVKEELRVTGNPLLSQSNRNGCERYTGILPTACLTLLVTSISRWKIRNSENIPPLPPSPTTSSHGNDMITAAVTATSGSLPTVLPITSPLHPSVATVFLVDKDSSDIPIDFNYLTDSFHQTASLFRKDTPPSEALSRTAYPWCGGGVGLASWDMWSDTPFSSTTHDNSLWTEVVWIPVDQTAYILLKTTLDAQDKNIASLNKHSKDNIIKGNENSSVVLAAKILATSKSRMRHVDRCWMQGDVARLVLPRLRNLSSDNVASPYVSSSRTTVDPTSYILPDNSPLLKTSGEIISPPHITTTIKSTEKITSLLINSKGSNDISKSDSDLHSVPSGPWDRVNDSDRKYNSNGLASTVGKMKKRPLLVNIDRNLSTSGRLQAYSDCNQALTPGTKTTVARDDPRYTSGKLKNYDGKNLVNLLKPVSKNMSKSSFAAVTKKRPHKLCMEHNIDNDEDIDDFQQ